MHGGGGGTGPGGIKKARIEIIPLIDVIFFLLATFVLFTITLNKSNGPKVELPQSTSSEPRDPAGTVTITVTADGLIVWDKDPVTMGDFLTRITQFKQQEPDGRVLINGDERALFAQALYVFEEVRKAGFNKIFIETQVKAPTR